MSPPPENSPTPAACKSETQENEFSLEERRILLALARDSILSVFEARELSLTPLSAHLNEPRGAFTTIYCRGDLRGCVGYVFPIAPLYRTVAETARAAAFEDTRFVPLTSQEVQDLELSISVLSPLRPIRPEEVEIGRHGLLISMAGQRGLLLPQVPVEHEWDRITFLEQTCRKAGLPSNAWQSAAIEAFTAEVFGDRDSAL